MNDADAIEAYSIEVPNAQNASESSDSFISLSNSSSQITPTASYAGYQELINDLNNQKTVSLSNYDVNTSFFKGGGWHQASDDSPAPYVVSVYSKANGDDCYLFQIGLLDLAWSNISVDKTFVASFTASYLVGCLAEYTPSTGKCEVIVVDYGVEFYDVKLGIGDLSNQACFVSCSAGSTSSTGNGVALLKALCNPKDVISNILDILTTDSTDSQFISISLGSRQQQLAKGGLYRCIGSEMTSGYLNDAGTGSVMTAHHVSVSGVGDQIDTTPVSCRFSWRYNSKTSL